jgi:hypothetical protein
MFATNPSLMVVYCHVVIFAETMDRDLEQEELLGDIIRDGSGDRMEEGGDHDGSGDRMEEGGYDGSAGVGALTVTKSGEVYIY